MLRAHIATVLAVTSVAPPANAVIALGIGVNAALGSAIGAINDQVGGFTNAQLFGLLNDDILTPAAYRNRMLQISNSAIHGAINDLYNSY